MLNEVKESILNAYEAKTGIRRNKLASLMDGETWFNAKKALELGFCDSILFSEEKKIPQEPEEDPEEDKEKKTEGTYKVPAPASAFLYSRKSVEDSFLSKVSLEQPENKVSIDSLKQRLNLIMH